MNAERWRQVRSIFELACEESSDGREALLERACGGEPAVRREVEKLLAAAEQAGDFLERPAAAGAGGLAQPTPREEAPQPPRRIGAYWIVGRLGHGGMGDVYLAHHRAGEELEHVALKVIRRGMDTEYIVERFRNERDILAGLDHPYIARLLGGGATEDGLPYFVMEYIDGEPIHTYCRRHQLPPVDRLELFLRVCGAVSFAHQNLVVHRDIKPRNILVTSSGVPKLLDFGLAKVLTPRLPADPASRTATVQRMLTPEYASPEQVRGDRITTASDVYSLGVLLFELLTGRRPYRVTGHTPEEIARAVCEVPPDRPEGIAEDLATILLMALRKEPQRRYGSVEKLAEDIRRYLAGLPVTARKDTFGYRAGKFLSRHRAGVAAASLLLVAVVTGVSATVWQARVAEAERARAERRYRDLRTLAGSLLFQFDDAITDLPGSTAARELLVKRALEYLSALEDESGEDLSLQRELAVAFTRVGEVQSRGFGLDLGGTSGALDSFHKAMVIRQAIVDADPDNLQDQDDLAESLLRIAGVLGAMCDPSDDVQYARQAVTIREVLIEADPQSTAFKSGLAAAYETLGKALMREVDVAGMLATFSNLLTLREQLLEVTPNDLMAQCDLAEAYRLVGLTHSLLGEQEEALATWWRAADIEGDLVIAHPGSERLSRGLASSCSHIGNLLNQLGQRQEALSYLGRAVTIGEALILTDPKNADVRHGLAEAYCHLGTALAGAGSQEEATAFLTKALELVEGWWRDSPANVQVAITLAAVYEGLGLASEPVLGGLAAGADPRSGWEAARGWYQRSLDVWHGLAFRDRLAPLYRPRPDRVAEAVVRCDAMLVSSSAGGGQRVAATSPPPVVPGR